MRRPRPPLAGLLLMSLCGCGAFLGLGGDDDDDGNTTPPSSADAASSNVDGTSPSADSPSAAPDGELPDGNDFDGGATIEQDAKGDEKIPLPDGGLFGKRIATFESHSLTGLPDGVDRVAAMELTGKSAKLVQEDSARTLPAGAARLIFDIPSLNSIDVTFAFRVDALPAAPVLLMRIGSVDEGLDMRMTDGGILSFSAKGGTAVTIAGKLAAGNSRRVFVRANPIAGNAEVVVVPTTTVKPPAGGFTAVTWSSGTVITEATVGRVAVGMLNQGLFTFDDFGIGPPKSF